MLSLRFRCVQALAKNASDPEVLARVSEAPAVVKASDARGAQARFAHFSFFRR